MKYRPLKKKDSDNRLSFRAGIRFQMEEGGAGLVAETHAQYKKFNTFFKASLSKKDSMGFGMQYPTGGNHHIAFDHQISRAANPLSGEQVSEKTTYDYLTFNYRF
jgi:hypothetical protein